MRRWERLFKQTQQLPLINKEDNGKKLYVVVHTIHTIHSLLATIYKSNRRPVLLIIGLRIEVKNQG